MLNSYSRFRSVLLYLPIFLCALVSTHQQAFASGFDAWLLPSTIKIFPDTLSPVTPDSEPLSLEAARNEYAPFQVAVRSDAPVTGIDVKIGSLECPGGEIPADSTELLLVENVTIEKPSMPTDRKIWPDPLPPFRKFDLEPDTTRGAWADLHVPADTPPGVCTGKVTVTAEGAGSTTLPFTVKVHKTLLPEKRSLRTAFGIDYGDLLEAHGAEENTPEALLLKDKYYWILVDHRLSPYHIPVDLFSEEAHDYLDDPRVDFLRAPMSWDRDEMQKIADRLRDTGWIDKAVFYIIDEPEPSQFPKVNEIGKWIHSFDPGFVYLITHGYTPALEEADIQIWCPVLLNTLDFTEIRNLYREMERGKQFWWYTCIGPKWEGMNYFIDELATAPRLHPWMNYLYGVSGILYWRTTCWHHADYDPWENPMTYPGGNGDGSLLYPGSKVGIDGPVASMRIKLLREGIEEYELLHLLAANIESAKERIGAAAGGYDTDRRLFEHAFSLIEEKGRANRLGEKTPYLMFVTKDYRVIDERRLEVLGEIESVVDSPLVLFSTEPVENGYTNDDYASVRGFAEDGAEVMVNGEKPRKT